MKKGSLILAVVALGMFLFAGSARALLIEFVDIGEPGMMVTTDNSTDPAHDMGYFIGEFYEGSTFNLLAEAGKIQAQFIPAAHMTVVDLALYDPPGYKTTPEVGWEFTNPIGDGCYGRLDIVWNGVTTSMAIANLSGGGGVKPVDNPHSPEPATLLLLGSGLLGLAGLGRKKFFKK